jgi:hypothetical protein
MIIQNHKNVIRRKEFIIPAEKTTKRPVMEEQKS